MARKATSSIFLFCFGAIATTAIAYGPVGHEIVGGIADQRLANTPTGAKVAMLIDGITLERASTMPDEIKSWDRNGAGDLSSYPHYPQHQKIEDQLRAFW